MKLILAVLAALTLSGCAHSIEGEAKPSVDIHGYLTAIKAAGISSTAGDVVLIRGAQLICDELKVKNGAVVVQELYQAGHVTMSEAEQVIFISTDFFCPEQDHRSGHQSS